jgi:hypothetical protein
MRDDPSVLLDNEPALPIARTDQEGVLLGKARGPIELSIQESAQLEILQTDPQGAVDQGSKPIPLHDLHFGVKLHALEPSGKELEGFQWT